MGHEALSGHTCNLPSFPKHVTTHAKLCQPPATSLGGDCLQVVCHLVVVTAHRAPDFQPLAHFAQVAAIHSILSQHQLCTLMLFYFNAVGCFMCLFWFLICLCMSLPLEPLHEP